MKLVEICSSSGGGDGGNSTNDCCSSSSSIRLDDYGSSCANSSGSSSSGGEVLVIVIIIYYILRNLHSLSGSSSWTCIGVCCVYLSTRHLGRLRSTIGGCVRPPRAGHLHLGLRP